MKRAKQRVNKRILNKLKKKNERDKSLLIDIQTEVRTFEFCVSNFGFKYSPPSDADLRINLFSPQYTMMVINCRLRDQALILKFKSTPIRYRDQAFKINNIHTSSNLWIINLIRQTQNYTD